MNPTYTDYLFTLFLNDKPISLETLLEQIEPSGKVSLESYQASKAIVNTLQKNGLVETTLIGGTEYIGLTEYGKTISALAADAITTKMLLEWQQKTLNGYSPMYTPTAENAPLPRPA